MTTVEQARELARQPLFALVLKREKAIGSRMGAYKSIGDALGRSATWVRGVVGRSPDVTVGLHDWLNINKLCDRLDAYSERLEAETAAIRGDDGTPDQIISPSGMGDVGQGAGSSAKVTR
ncbi:hypothetical protein MKK88_05930 [Methylobacterium sp. E-005]|uniref:hypothetical protein n=1 Tax=Methylobacterium sp. E-005 TaxID=2836549 RepID=UPI001FBA2C1E|nr:hypothetical protein [Methylobacterium sp. E-005]MCJ2085534.1 hypothetical protein [Methylobacterium sp. E-005]